MAIKTNNINSVKQGLIAKHRCGYYSVDPMTNIKRVDPDWVVYTMIALKGQAAPILEAVHLERAIDKLIDIKSGVVRYTLSQPTSDIYNHIFSSLPATWSKEWRDVYTVLIAKIWIAHSFMEELANLTPISISALTDCIPAMFVPKNSAYASLPSVVILAAAVGEAYKEIETKCDRLSSVTKQLSTTAPMGRTRSSLNAILEATRTTINNWANKINDTATTVETSIEMSIPIIFEAMSKDTKYDPDYGDIKTKWVSWGNLFLDVDKLTFEPIARKDIEQPRRYALQLHDDFEKALASEYCPFEKVLPEVFFGALCNVPMATGNSMLGRNYHLVYFTGIGKALFDSANYRYKTPEDGDWSQDTTANSMSWAKRVQEVLYEELFQKWGCSDDSPFLIGQSSPHISLLDKSSPYNVETTQRLLQMVAIFAAPDIRLTSIGSTWALEYWVPRARSQGGVADYTNVSEYHWINNVEETVVATLPIQLDGLTLYKHPTVSGMAAAQKRPVRNPLLIQQEIPDGSVFHEISCTYDRRTGTYSNDVRITCDLRGLDGVVLESGFNESISDVLGTMNRRGNKQEYFELDRVTLYSADILASILDNLVKQNMDAYIDSLRLKLFYRLSTLFPSEAIQLLYNCMNDARLLPFVIIDQPSADDEKVLTRGNQIRVMGAILSTLGCDALGSALITFADKCQDTYPLSSLAIER